jgi:Ca-activated chloride channel homolog
MKTFPIIAIIFLITGAAFADQIYTKNKKANQLYKKGEYNEALKMYEDLAVESPSEPKIKMNKGSALFQMDSLDKAEESYNGAATGLKDKKALADLYYNLGNAQYMQGEKLAAQQNQGASEKYKAALENYIKSLDLRPHDRDAKWNLQLANAKMKQMQNQQQKNQNDKNKNDKNDKKQDQKNQQQDQKKNDQNKQDQNKKDQNKDQQNKDNKQQQDKNNQEQQKQTAQNDKNKDQQKPEPTPQQQKQEDMKKDEAKKLIELYSDDEHDLNKKPEKAGVVGERKGEKDW